MTVGPSEKRLSLLCKSTISHVAHHHVLVFQAFQQKVFNNIHWKSKHYTSLPRITYLTLSANSTPARMNLSSVDTTLGATPSDSPAMFFGDIGEFDSFDVSQSTYRAVEAMATN